MPARDVEAGVSYSPPFSQADLTNCERELIHLAGSIQPHGLLMVLGDPGLRVVQRSANAAAALRLGEDALAGTTLDAALPRLADHIASIAAGLAIGEAVPLHDLSAGAEWDGILHRIASDRLIVELEPHPPPTSERVADDQIEALLTQTVERLSAAPTLGVLADGVARSVRDMTGYDRVMVYKFDPDGHGQIIAESRDPRLESLLGHRYPASDIPQRARELYVRNRVRVLVDVNYEPVPVVPRLDPQTGAELDMSLCQLRSMSPLHLQYLKNMGVTATLVVSLVREGRLWGLIAAHHYRPRHIGFVARAAVDLVAEVMTTRIAAIESYAQAQVALLVRRLEQRLIDATSTEGDWRLALFRNPSHLLQPLEATGAALFQQGEILTAGEVPSTAELRMLGQWIDGKPRESPFACSSVGQANPALESLTPLASGVLAVRLSGSRDYLMWFRKEQLMSVTWAGDPTKPMIGNDPLELSPRRSFAAWSEIVRGTAQPWTSAQIALARAIGIALVDIIVQVHAVRLLIAEHQLAGIRKTLEHSQEPVIVFDPDGRTLFANQSFERLTGLGSADLADAAALAAVFPDPAQVLKSIAALRGEARPWRTELLLARTAGEPIPVAVRADGVAGRDGALLGTVVILTDLSDQHRTAAARRQLERALENVAKPPRSDATTAGERDDVLAAILTNASLAAMDIADAPSGPTIAPLIDEVGAATQRAGELYRRIRALIRREGPV